MSFEKIKSILLTVLVLLSIGLTWTIWTYQPHFDTMDKGETVPEVSLGDRKELVDIVRPDRVFFHYGDKTFGTNETRKIDYYIWEIRQWEFSHLKDISSEVKDVGEFARKAGHIEIVFPDSIPLQTYKKILNFEEDDETGVHFDRIVIDTNEADGEFGSVYFVSTEKQEMSVAQVAASFIAEIKENEYKNAENSDQFQEYVSVQFSEERNIYVPKEAQTMSSNSYLVDVISTKKFRDALFTDPSLVKRNLTQSGEEYTDSSTLLSINDETNTVLYVNTAEKSGEPVSLNKLLEQSISFVNSHGGWTDNYRLVQIDEVQQTVLFRIYDSFGYPIFNDNGMSELMQIWGDSTIHQYLRNKISIGRQVETKKITMMSGVEAAEQLKKEDDLDLAFVEDLVLGLNMSKNPNEPLISLEPSWFYKYKGQWHPLDTGGQGGDDLGLE